MNTIFDPKTILMMAKNNHLIEIDGQHIQMTIVEDAETNKLKQNYSHLIEKWVKRIANSNTTYTINKWYKVVADKTHGIGIAYDSGGDSYCTTQNLSQSLLLECFDLSNPLDHNPDDVS